MNFAKNISISYVVGFIAGIVGMLFGIQYGDNIVSGPLTFAGNVGYEATGALYSFIVMTIVSVITFVLLVKKDKKEVNYLKVLFAVIAAVIGALLIMSEAGPSGEFLGSFLPLLGAAAVIDEYRQKRNVLGFILIVVLLLTIILAISKLHAPLENIWMEVQEKPLIQNP